MYFLKLFFLTWIFLEWREYILFLIIYLPPQFLFYFILSRISSTNKAIMILFLCGFSNLFIIDFNKLKAHTIRVLCSSNWWTPNNSQNSKTYCTYKHITHITKTLTQNWKGQNINTYLKKRVVCLFTQRYQTPRSYSSSYHDCS